jgi:putative ABC transport system permease protein
LGGDAHRLWIPLRKNKLRSFLTLLGIILATTTLIAVTALIHGMNRLHRRQGLQYGFRRLPHRAHGVVRSQWDPKKFYEMQKRNPQIQRGRIRVRQGARPRC